MILFLGAVCCAVLGAYSAIVGIIAGFEGTDAVSSFGCKHMSVVRWV